MNTAFERNATRYISKLSNRLKRRLDAISAFDDLPGSQSSALRFLLTRDDILCQKDLEDEYSIRASTASELLNQLEAKGYLYRVENPANRRQKLIHLTEKARSLDPGIEDRLMALDDDLTRGIAPEQLEACLDTLEIMLKNMEKF